MTQKSINEIKGITYNDNCKEIRNPPRKRLDGIHDKASPFLDGSFDWIVEKNKREREAAKRRKDAEEKREADKKKREREAKKRYDASPAGKAAAKKKFKVITLKRVGNKQLICHGIPPRKR